MELDIISELATRIAMIIRYEAFRTQKAEVISCHISSVNDGSLNIAITRS